MKQNGFVVFLAALGGAAILYGVEHFRFDPANSFFTCFAGACLICISLNPFGTNSSRR